MVLNVHGSCTSAAATVHHIQALAQQQLQQLHTIQLLTSSTAHCCIKFVTCCPAFCTCVLLQYTGTLQVDDFASHSEPEEYVFTVTADAVGEVDKRVSRG